MGLNVLIFNTQRQESKELLTILNSAYTCQICTTVAKGLSLLKKKNNDIDIVICDLTTNLKEGGVFITAIRSDFALATIPILVVASNTGHEYQEGIRLGANGFLLKPYNREVVLNIVKGGIDFKLHPQLIGTLQRDYLTGLLNRAGFFIEAKKLIDAQKPGYYVLSCFDIDSFKVINDQYGTSTGDAVLKELADKLQSYVTKVGGLACRYMADRFSMIYPAKEIDTKITKLYQKKVTQSIIIAHPVNIKIGHYFVQDKSVPIEIMCDRATLAEESIKGLYGVYIADYTEKMRDKLLQEQKVVNEMAIDLKRGEFTAWYQAQYDATTNTIVGAEALARWIKNGKVIPPMEFIPIFEKNGFIYELDKYIWEEVCKNIQKWTKQGLTPIPISVNVSRYDILQPDFKKVINQLLKEYNVPKSVFRLEVTESAFDDKERRIVRLVNELINEGFTIKIDDFGSGYSSLNVLKDVRASVVKLDMGFFEDTENTRRSGSIIESVIRMTHWLGMQVIAEGVDKQFQADYLLSVGCSIIQGYLYAKPIPMADFEKLIIDSKVAPKPISFDTLDNFDNNAFWDAKSQETLIFNSYVGGACIFEYHNDRTELLRYNKNYEAIFDYPFSFTFFSDDSPEKFASPTNFKLYIDTMKKAIESKKEETCELKLVKTVGHKKYYLYLEMTMRLIAQAEDRYIFYCMMANKTQERLSRKKEREANKKKLDLAKRLNSIIENIHGGVVAFEVMGKTLKYVFTNQQYFEIIGVAKTQYMKNFTGIFKMIHPDDRGLVSAAYEQAVATKNPHHLEFRIIRPNGEIRWLSCNVDNFTADDDKALIYLVFINDITDIIVSKQRALELASQMEGIIQSINGGLSAVSFSDDGNMNLVYASDKYYEIYGYTKEEYEERKIDLISLIMPEDVAGVVSKGRDIIFNDTPGTFEYRAVKKDGSVIHLKCSSALSNLWGSKKKVLVSILNDISQEKDTQEQLNVITNATNYMQNQPDFEKSLNYILYSMLDYYQCDRAFIIELDYSKTYFTCNYEVHKEEVSNDKALINTVPYKDVTNLLDILSEDRFVNITDTSKMDDNPELKATLLTQKVHSIVWGPIWREGKLIALMGINNPNPTLAKNPERMKALANYVSVLLTRRDFMRNISSDDASLKEFETLLRVIPSGVMKYSAADGTFAYINNNLVLALGYNETEFRMKFHNNFNEMVYSEDRERVMQEIDKQESQGNIGKFEYRVEAKDGRLHWFHDEGVRIVDQDGKVWYYVTVVDVTKRVAAQEEARKNSREFELAAALSGNIICKYDNKRKFLTLDEKVAQREGIPMNMNNVPESLIKGGFIKKEHEEHYRLFFEHIRAGYDLQTVAFQYRFPSGWRWISAKAALVYDKDKKPVSAIISFRDNTQEIILREKAEKDTLTELYNRDAFANRIKERIESKNAPKLAAMFLLDLDDFKGINDTYGHAYGDVVIQKIGKGLSSLFVEEDAILARLGGDEFLVFLPHPQDLAEISKCAEKIVAAVPGMVGPKIKVSTSIGIALFPQDGKDFISLYHHVDKALYKVKDAGKNNYGFYK